MLTNALWFALGLGLLLVGGRLVVSASIDAARRLGVSPLVVGLTLVAWGTSAPELALNLISASKDRGDLALGNVVGANICNLALVLGVCSLIKPLAVQERLVKVEIGLNALILCILAALALFADLSPASAGLLLAVFVIYSLWTITSALRQPQSHTLGDDPAHTHSPMSWILIVACFIGGLALLSFGGSFASDGAAGIAIALGVPPAVVGVTIVSIGTTLPELTTGILAIRKGQNDLAMGNAIGSCIFNAGAIYGIAGLIAPTPVDPALTLALWFMGGLALALIPISRSSGRSVSRIAGGLLLSTYIAFLAASAWNASTTTP